MLVCFFKSVDRLSISFFRSNNSRPPSQNSISLSDFRLEDGTYVNWPHLDSDSALGPSPANDSKANEDEESLPGSSIYDFPPGASYDGLFTVLYFSAMFHDVLTFFRIQIQVRIFTCAVKDWRKLPSVLRPLSFLRVRVRVLWSRVRVHKNLNLRVRVRMVRVRVLRLILEVMT